MASEPNIVEIYVDVDAKDVVIYIPAADMLTNGEDLPKNTVFIKQININDVVDHHNTLKIEEARARL